MAKSVVLFGPVASGKTRYGKEIARRIGLEHVMDLDDVQLQGEGLQRSGYLYLSNSEAYAERATRLLGTNLLHIDAALACIGVRPAEAKSRQEVTRV